MIVETIACNNCGAPLNVPPTANFATCAHCNSQLVIRRNDTARFTETLDRIEDYTERIAEDVEHIRLQNDLERLDREWQRERRRFLLRERDGVSRLPTRSYVISRVLVSIVALVLTTLWFGLASSAGDGALFFGWFGLIVVAITIANAVISIVRGINYNTAKQEYQTQREEILRRLSQDT
jgi:hypothetical protein